MARWAWNKGITTKGDKERVCCRCKEQKALAEFKKNKKMYLGYSGTCKACHNQDSKSYWRTAAGLAAKTRFKERLAVDSDLKRTQRNRALKYRFGITIKQYEAMKDAQGGRCAICDNLPSNKDLDVDHDHETGEVRGLLCPPCNRGIGQLKDDPMLLIRAAEYLTSYSSAKKREVA